MVYMVYNFFDKKTRLGAKASVIQEPAQELHKPVTKKLKKKESLCEIWAVDLDETRSMFSKKQGIKYLLRFIDVFTKCTSVKPLKKS